ncbi:unnamed protein product, partial [Porites lobata]
VPVGVEATAFLLSFLTVFGNSLVVIAIVKDPFSELRTIPNYLILNLAACDLIVGIPSKLLLSLSHFYVSYNLYYVAFTSLYTSMVSSALTVLTLAFDRYIMLLLHLTCKLQSHFFIIIHSHLRLVIVYVWLIALCVALLSLLNRCNEAEYRLIITDAIGFPVMALMFLIYSRIFLLMQKWIRQDLDLSISESQRLLGSDNLSENIRTRERHIAFSVFLFVSVFALCWTPCFVMENVFYKYRRSPTLATTADWVRLSGLLSSLLNPVIYALRYEKFRKAIRQIF